jgi:hypothetical protein
MGYHDGYDISSLYNELYVPSMRFGAISHPLTIFSFLFISKVLFMVGILMCTFDQNVCCL